MAEIIQSPAFEDPEKQKLAEKNDNALVEFLRLVELGVKYAKRIGAVGPAFMRLFRAAEKKMEESVVDLEVGS